MSSSRRERDSICIFSSREGTCADRALAPISDFKRKNNACWCILNFRHSSSFSDASSDSLLFDTGLMIAGYALMFLYTVAMLGRPNAVEQRAYLAMAGISAVGMGMVVSLGLTMAFGFFYTTIHGVLPFLAMGESFFTAVVFYSGNFGFRTRCGNVNTEQSISCTTARRTVHM